jgi:hypothetical protein
MLAVTIAAGREYYRLALRAAESVARRTGLDVRIVTQIPEGRHPSYHRLWLWDLVPARYDQVLYFDADTYFVRPAQPWEWLGRYDFAARKDLPSGRLIKECQRYELDFGRYVNAGVFVAHRRVRACFELAQRIATAPDYESGYLEQTALNAGLQRGGADIRLMPPACNAICRPANVPIEPIVLHRAGGGANRRNARLFERLIAESIADDSPPPNDHRLPITDHRSPITD